MSKMKFLHAVSQMPELQHREPSEVGQPKNPTDYSKSKALQWLLALPETAPLLLQLAAESRRVVFNARTCTWRGVGLEEHERLMDRTSNRSFCRNVGDPGFQRAKPMPSGKVGRPPGGKFDAQIKAAVEANPGLERAAYHALVTPGPAGSPPAPQCYATIGRMIDRGALRMVRGRVYPVDSGGAGAEGSPAAAPAKPATSEATPAIDLDDF